jgi:hypothetical protein
MNSVTTLMTSHSKACGVCDPVACFSGVCSYQHFYKLWHSVAGESWVLALNSVTTLMTSHNTAGESWVLALKASTGGAVGTALTMNSVTTLMTLHNTAGESWVLAQQSLANHELCHSVIPHCRRELGADQAEQQHLPCWRHVPVRTVPPHGGAAFPSW